MYNQLKEINISIFKFFNEILGKPAFDPIMIFADKFGGPHYFHYHFLLIMLIATILFYCKRDDKIAMKELFISGFAAMCSLFFSVVVCIIIIADLLKDYAGVNRPYCSLENVYIIPQIAENLSCTRAFPSGHLTFSIILIASFWPLFNRLFKIIAVCFVILVAISRMAAGAHYPADLLGALVICLPITLFIRNRVDIIVRKYEARFNAFEYIYKYIPNCFLK